MIVRDRRYVFLGESQQFLRRILYCKSVFIGNRRYSRLFFKKIKKAGSGKKAKRSEVFHGKAFRIILLDIGNRGGNRFVLFNARFGFYVRENFSAKFIKIREDKKGIYVFRILSRFDFFNRKI